MAAHGQPGCLGGPPVHTGHSGETALAPARLILTCRRGHKTRVECQAVWRWEGRRYPNFPHGYETRYSWALQAHQREGRYFYPWSNDWRCPECQAGIAKVAQVHGHYAADVRCNAKCQDAHGTSCECSCGGLNHGIGVPDREVHTLAPAQARQQALLNGRKRARRNPPDRDFTVLLGQGMFSKAYARPDHGASEDAVQIVTTPSVGGVYRQGTEELVDVSKAIITLARQSLRSDPEALAYLPQVRPLRLDRNPDTGSVEFVYSMKRYAEVDREAMGEVGARVYQALTTASGHMDHWGKDMQRFLRIRLRSNAILRRPLPPMQVVRQVWAEGKALARALHALHIVASGLDLRHYAADHYLDNLSMDEANHLILRDPMVAEMRTADAIALWQQHGWDRPHGALANGRVLTGDVAPDGTIGRMVKGPDGKRRRVREHLTPAELAAPDWRRLRAEGVAVEGTPTTDAVVAEIEHTAGPIAPTRSESIIVTGNTFMLRRQIKAMGGRWLGDQKAWIVPADQLAALEQLAQGNKIQLELSNLPAPPADPDQERERGAIPAPAPAPAASPVQAKLTPAQAFRKVLQEPPEPVAHVTPKTVKWAPVSGPTPLVRQLQLSADEFNWPVGMFGWRRGEEVQIDAWPPPHDAPGGKRYLRETLSEIMRSAKYTFPGRKVDRWMQLWNEKVRQPGAGRYNWEAWMPDLDGYFSSWSTGTLWKYHKPHCKVDWDVQALWTRDSVALHWADWTAAVQKRIAQLATINDEAFFNANADPEYRLRLAQRYDALAGGSTAQSYVAESALGDRWDRDRTLTWEWLGKMIERKASPAEIAQRITAERQRQYDSTAAKEEEDARKEADMRQTARAFCAAIDANGGYLTIHALRKLGAEVGFELDDHKYREERYSFSSKTIPLPHFYGARTQESLARRYQAMCILRRHNALLSDHEANKFVLLDEERQKSARVYSATVGTMRTGWNEETQQWIRANAQHLSDKEIAEARDVIDRVLRDRRVRPEVEEGVTVIDATLAAEQQLRAPVAGAKANGRASDRIAVQQHTENENAKTWMRKIKGSWRSTLARIASEHGWDLETASAHSVAFTRQNSRVHLFERNRKWWVEVGPRTDPAAHFRMYEGTLARLLTDDSGRRDHATERGAFRTAAAFMKMNAQNREEGRA